MKVFYIFVTWFLISTVNCGIDEFSANDVEKFYEDLESFDNDQPVQKEIICPEVGDVLSSATVQNIQFEITFPESIRYMEVSKVNVMIYNRMNSSESLDLEVSIPNEGDNSKFEFFNNKCNSSLSNKSEFPKIINVQQGMAQSFSFYIQTIKNRKQSSNFSNIVLKASMKNENYECYLKKGVKIVSAKIKTYNVNPKSFNLNSSVKSNTMIISNYSKDSITRIYVEITADQSIYPNFSIALTNDGDFSEIVNGKDLNGDTPIEVMFPENTTHAKTTINGSGLCTIKFIIEDTISISNPRSHFNLKITPLSSSSENEAIVQVCATYYDDEEYSRMKTLPNVIYDVEMPSGYVFKEVIDISQKPEIRVE